MSVCNDDLLAAIKGMSTRFDALEATVQGQGKQLGSFAEALRAMQDSRANAAAWQAEVASPMEAIDKVIEELQRDLKKESPQHKFPRTIEQNAAMADVAATPVRDPP